MATVFITIAILAVLCAIILNSLNKLQQRRNAVLAALVSLRKHIVMRRMFAFDIALLYMDLQKSGVAKALQNAPVSSDTAEAPVLAADEAQFERLLETIVSQITDPHRASLAEAGEKIGRAAAHYNKCVREYNTGLLALPAAFFANIYKYKSFDVF